MKVYSLVDRIHEITGKAGTMQDFVSFPDFFSIKSFNQTYHEKSKAGHIALSQKEIQAIADKWTVKIDWTI